MTLIQISCDSEFSSPRFYFSEIRFRKSRNYILENNHNIKKLEKIFIRFFPFFHSLSLFLQLEEK